MVRKAGSPGTKLGWPALRAAMACWHVSLSGAAREVYDFQIAAPQCGSLGHRSLAGNHASMYGGVDLAVADVAGLLERALL